MSMPAAEWGLPKRVFPVWVLGGDNRGDAPLVEIPLLGIVTAGQPIERLEDPRRVRIPAGMVRKYTYALMVRGRSMIGEGIRDGDVIVVEKRETAANGQSVVALINGERVTLKRFFVEPDGIRLQPANPGMAPIRLANEEVQILGIVTGIVRIPRPQPRLSST